MMHLSVTMLKKHSFQSRKKQKGAVAILVALSIVALVGFLGLALDLGKLFVAKSELQNSADACALAAIREVTGANTNQLTLAEAAGITAGMRHSVLFQDETITLTPDNSVKFSETLTGTYRTKSAVSGAEALNMKYARCTVERTGIVNWFMGVLNLLPGVAIGDQAVAAAAVASNTPSQIVSCAIPVGVCQSALTPPPPVGSWLRSVIGSSTNDLTGNFMWVDYSPPAGGASELNGYLSGDGVCNLPALGSEVGQAGVVSSLASGWNTRFGIYHGSNKQGDSTPDYTGYAYVTGHDGVPSTWVPNTPYNKFADFTTKRGTHTAYQGDGPTGLKTKPATYGNSGYLTSDGGDRRMATVAVIDCPGLISGATAPVTAWACVLMLHPINSSQGGSGTGTGADRMYLEYLGMSDDEDSPCATSGVPGGPTSGGPMVPALVR